MRRAKDGELVGLDIEMFGMSKPHWADGTFAALSVGYVDGESYLIRDARDIPNVLEDVANGMWCMQNALFDLRVLRRYTDVSQRYVHDTMLVELDLFGGWYSRFGLDSLARRHLGQKLDKTIRKEFDKATEMTAEMEVYAREDAVVTAQIAQKQLDYIYETYDGIMPWYMDIDEPALWAVLDMPPARVDTGGWSNYAKVMVADAEAAQDALGFNVNSHKIVKAEIESRLGKGIKNTNANETLLPMLSKLEADHPAAVLIREIMRIRQLRKLAETYGDSWLSDVVDGYVRASYRVTGAETGRMACADPNLQNIPKRERPIYRTFFPASPGHVMQVADVSQQEPWFLAFLSKDRVLLQELHNQIDLHQVTADLFGVDRDKGKAINLGLNYGMSEFGLAARVDISVDDAKAGIVARDRRYRQATAWKAQKIREARQSYRVHTVTGRPIWVNPYMDGWERNAINAPVQGSAADHTKLAMAKLHKKCKEEELPFRVTMVVHDEMVQDVPIIHAEKYAKMLEASWNEASKELAPGMGMTTKVLQGETWGVKE